MPLELVANRHILEMQYAVRGPIPQRAAELKKEGRQITPCHIGNPQALGQRPISYYRQVVSLLEDPARIDRERKLRDMIAQSAEGEELSEFEPLSDFVLDLADDILTQLGTGMGAYTESKGPLFMREAVARFIDARDGVDASNGVPSDPHDIFLLNGASEAAWYIFAVLIADPNDGVMIPIPQYPLYSATLEKWGGRQVNYYPDEDCGWCLERSMLEESYSKAVSEGTNVKAIVVINPANPTGAILDGEHVKEVIDFAESHGLIIIADEVYQENTYGEEFVSFAEALGDGPTPLLSLHSTSKGFYGECGHRGGYLEVRNSPKIAGSDMLFTDVLLKQGSVRLCANTVGQVLTHLMVTRPQPGDDAYDQFETEKNTILDDLYDKATIVRAAFDEMDGVHSFGRIGAMYLFPRLDSLPEGATDFDYCMALLEETGVCTVNGSGFGEREGTRHLRVAFLPPKEVLEEVLPDWIEFHNAYVAKTKAQTVSTA